MISMRYDRTHVGAAGKCGSPAAQRLSSTFHAGQSWPGYLGKERTCGYWHVRKISPLQAGQTQPDVTVPYLSSTVAAQIAIVPMTSGGDLWSGSPSASMLLHVLLSLWHQCSTGQTCHHTVPLHISNSHKMMSCVGGAMKVWLLPENERPQESSREERQNVKKGNRQW